MELGNFHEIIYSNDLNIAVNYKILDINPSYELIVRKKREDVINKLATEIYSTDEPPFLDIFCRVADSGETEQLDIYFGEQLGLFR